MSATVDRQRRPLIGQSQVGLLLYNFIGFFEVVPLHLFVHFMEVCGSVLWAVISTVSLISSLQVPRAMRRKTYQDRIGEAEDDRDCGTGPGAGYQVGNSRLLEELGLGYCSSSYSTLSVH